MRIAIFGGTGFLGYDFVRLLLEEGGWEPVVYCSSPTNLANLRRHAIDIRLVPPAQLPDAQLDPGIDTIVNFAHPFARRDGLAPDQQTDLFARFLRNARGRNDRLRLVHLSTMSVYEPFAAGREFDEAAVLDPPSGDGYANSKVYSEKALRALPDAEAWQLMLRPTIVYGPFCRPWTDNLLQAFAEGDVRHGGLTGRIQPIWGHDMSRFIRGALDAFRPGTFNLAGEATMTWLEFLTAFRDVVGKGSLVQVPPTAPGGDPSRLTGAAFCVHHLRALYADLVRHPSFLALGASAARFFPVPFVARVQRALGIGAPGAVKSTGPAPAAVPPSRFTQPFFAEDRLVSRHRFAAAHPAFHTTPLSDVRDTLGSYYEYRFTDKLHV